VVCGITVITTTIIGVPIAYVMTRYNVAGKQLLHILIIMSLMSPPFIGAYSWIILMGRNGLIAKLFKLFGATAPTIYGREGIIFVFTLHLFPYIYLYTSGAMNSIDSSLEEAAENLGMNKLKRIWTITLPVILPSILAGCVMVFMTALADFGTPMLLGEGYTVLEVDGIMFEAGAVDPVVAEATLFVGNPVGIEIDDHASACVIGKLHCLIPTFFKVIVIRDKGGLITATLSSDTHNCAGSGCFFGKCSNTKCDCHQTNGHNHCKNFFHKQFPSLF
jgi:ABC-type molybdate transport system permease subunit